MNYGNKWRIFTTNLSTKDLNKFNIDKFYNIIENNKFFVITTHINPDGDAIGSAMALFFFLKLFNKEVKVINHSETPKYYQFLDPKSEIETLNNTNSDIIINADVIFLVDLNEVSRVKSLKDIVLKSKAKKIIIDHHQPNSPFADFEFTDVEASSTGEIIYKLISHKYNSYINKDIATSLFAAIMTDTQSFHLPRTTSEVFRIAADLVDKGANPPEIYKNIYETNDPNRFYLLSEVLSNMKIIKDGKIVYFIVKQEMFDKTNTLEPDVENFINYGLQIATAEIVIFFVELKDGVKISFRSRNNIPINELAKIYGGNGHINAAGARLYNISLNEILPDVLNNAVTFLN